MSALAAQASASPSPWSLLAAIAITCAGLWGLALAAPVAAPRRGRHAAGAQVPPGMSLPEPLDRDYVEEQR
jgi:hypothetical protein